MINSIIVRPHRDLPPPREEVREAFRGEVKATAVDASLALRPTRTAATKSRDGGRKVDKVRAEAFIRINRLRYQQAGQMVNRGITSRID